MATNKPMSNKDKSNINRRLMNTIAWAEVLANSSDLHQFSENLQVLGTVIEEAIEAIKPYCTTRGD